MALSSSSCVWDGWCRVRVFEPYEGCSRSAIVALQLTSVVAGGGKKFALFSSPDQHAFCCGSVDVRGWRSLKRGSIAGGALAYLRSQALGGSEWICSSPAILIVKGLIGYSIGVVNSVESKLFNQLYLHA